MDITKDITLNSKYLFLLNYYNLRRVRYSPPHIPFLISANILRYLECILEVQICHETGATLLVSKLDRLGRRVSFISTLMEDKRLALSVAQMPNADKFQLHIYAALAEQERDFISKRTKAALSEAKRRGVKLGGARPENGERHRAIAEEADRNAQRVAELVVPLRRAGRSLQQIADSLNSSGVSAARGGSSPNPDLR